MARDVVKEVEMFCYLGGVFSTEGTAQGTVTTRIRAGGKRFSDGVSIRKVC